MVEGLKLCERNEIRKWNNFLKSVTLQAEMKRILHSYTLKKKNFRKYCETVALKAIYCNELSVLLVGCEFMHLIEHSILSSLWLKQAAS